MTTYQLTACQQKETGWKPILRSVCLVPLRAEVG